MKDPKVGDTAYVEDCNGKWTQYYYNGNNWISCRTTQTTATPTIPLEFRTNADKDKHIGMNILKTTKVAHNPRLSKNGEEK